MWTPNKTRDVLTKQGMVGQDFELKMKSSSKEKKKELWIGEEEALIASKGSMHFLEMLKDNLKNDFRGENNEFWVWKCAHPIILGNHCKRAEKSFLNWGLTCNSDTHSKSNGQNTINCPRNSIT